MTCSFKSALILSAVLTLSACMAPMGDDTAATGTGATDLAPPIPVDTRPKGDFEKMTGINSDAVAAISGNATRSYVYYDLFAARKAAVAAAPQRLCNHYGRSLKASHVAEPGDRVPGMKALVVECR